MPVGSSRATTSIGHTHPRASTSSCSRPRGRPGCTRYQWPRSMASVTAPRNAAPASVRSSATAGLPPASRAAATRPTTPMATGTRSRTGGNSGPASSATAVTVDPRRSMPVIAATRAVRRSCSARWPATPALRRTIDTTSPTRQPAATPSEADLADRHGAERDPGEERADGHQQVDAAQQPAVAEADLAAPCREPAERHPADRPLQQHGGGVEGDHTSGGYRRSVAPATGAVGPTLTRRCPASSCDLPAASSGSGWRSSPPSASRGASPASARRSPRRRR